MASNRESVFPNLTEDEIRAAITEKAERSAFAANAFYGQLRTELTQEQRATITAAWVRSGFA